MKIDVGSIAKSTINLALSFRFSMLRKRVRTPWIETRFSLRFSKNTGLRGGKILRDES